MKKSAAMQKVIGAHAIVFKTVTATCVAVNMTRVKKPKQLKKCKTSVNTALMILTFKWKASKDSSYKNGLGNDDDDNPSTWK